MWSTSQAVEIVSGLLAGFRINGYALSPEVEQGGAKAVGAGLDVLIQEGNRRGEWQMPVRIQYVRKKTDVIGLVWQLRAISQVLGASRVLSLPVQTESLIQRGETLLRELFVLQDANGGWSSFGDIGKSSYVTGMAVWAIGEASPVFERAEYLRPHKVHGSHIAVEWMLGNRIPGSGIPFFEGGAVAAVSRTALASIALWARHQMKCAETVPDVELALNSAFIIHHQDPSSGAWSDSLEEHAEPNVEVTSLAILALLKSGTSPSHPSIEKGIDWLLSCFRIEGGTHSGWGLYSFPADRPNLRIWTTWYGVLALWEFVSRSRGQGTRPVECTVDSKPRLVLMTHGGRKTVTLGLSVRGVDRRWAFLRMAGQNSRLELDEPSVVQLQEPRTNISLRLRQSAPGLAKGDISLQDLVDGNTVNIHVRTIAFGEFGRSVLSILWDAKILMASVAVSSAIYALFKFSSRITRDAVSDFLWIAFGAVVIILILGFFKYLSRE